MLVAQPFIYLFKFPHKLMHAPLAAVKSTAIMYSMYHVYGLSKESHPLISLYIAYKNVVLPKSLILALWPMGVACLYVFFFK